MLVAPVWAAEFELHPTLYVAQHYTDNVALAARGLERSEWITEATPGFVFNYNGAKLKYSATISGQALYRANEGTTESHMNFTGGTNGSIELVPSMFYLDTNSSVAQQNTSVLGPQALSNINTTANRATVWYTNISPYVRYNFGSEASTEVRYTYSTVNSDAPAVRGTDSGSNRINARLTSGPGYKVTTWNVAYSYEKIDYTNARDTTAQTFTAGARRLLTPVFGLVANVGYEDNDFISTGETPKGVQWSAGVDWTPTPRTHLLATTGERFYGKTYSLDFSHRTRLTVWNANYTEDVTTYRQQVQVPTQANTATYLDTLYISRIPDPAARQQAVQDFIVQSGLPPTMIVPVNFLTNQTYLQKSARAAAGLQGPIHTIMANVFWTTRDALSAALPGAAGDFGASSNIKQTGTGLLWNWRLTAQDSANMSLAYTVSETPGLAREDRSKYLRAAYNHQFSPKMTGMVTYLRTNYDSNIAGSSYTENQAVASLQMRF